MTPQPDAMDYHLLSRIGTAPDANSSIFVSKLGRSFLALASAVGSPPLSVSSAPF
jgi:hypothetical protein